MRYMSLLAVVFFAAMMMPKASGLLLVSDIWH